MEGAICHRRRLHQGVVVPVVAGEILVSCTVLFDRAVSISSIAYPFIGHSQVATLFSLPDDWLATCISSGPYVAQYTQCEITMGIGPDA